MSNSKSEVNPAYIVDCWSDNERMNFLFSAFPPTRSSNPHHWDTKMSFWKNLIKEISMRNQCGYVTWDNTFRHISRNGKQPLGLHIVFDSLIEQGELVPESRYIQDIKSDETWMGWGVKWCVRKPVTWMADKVLSPIKTSPHKNLKNGRFVFVPVLEKKSDLLVSKLREYLSGNATQDYDFLNIVSYSKLKELVEDILCDHESLDLALMTLRKNKTIDVWSPDEVAVDGDAPKTDALSEKYVKFAKSSKKFVIPFSETDMGIVKLCETKTHLTDAIETSYREIEKCRDKARECLRNNQRTLAKNALRRKKRLEASLEKKEGSLGNVEQLLESLHQCKTDKMVMDTYKSAKAAYKDATNGMSLEEVQSTMDDVANVMDAQSDITEALSGPKFNDADDIQDLEEELSALLSTQESNGVDDLCSKIQNFEINGHSHHLPSAPTHSPKHYNGSQENGIPTTSAEKQLAV